MDQVLLTVPFDLQKNKETVGHVKLNNKDDFQKLAKNLKNCGNEYCCLVKNSYPILISKCMSAICVNACFACELFLKALLLSEKFDYYRCIKKPENKHNLYDLFSHLTDSTKSHIKNITAKKDIFELELKEIGAGFEILRYASELNGVVVDVCFLLALMDSLEIVANQALPE